MHEFKNTIAFVSWFIVAFIVYLFVTLLISWFSDLPFRQAGCGSHQIYLFLLVYWWCPAIIVACEVHEYCESR